MSLSRSLFAAGALLLAAGLPAHAVNEAQRVEERLPPVVRPGDRPPPAPIKVPGAQDLTSFPEFTLSAVVVEGATVLSPADTAECSANLIGKTIGVIEVTELTQCITRLYRDRGYFLSRAIVPPQEVNGGVLKVQAIEGYIASIQADGIDQADADAQFAETLNERPGRLATFERGLLLLADRYGHRVTTSQLAADPNDHARFTFQLAVEVTPVAWRAYGDNRGTENAGPEQLLGWLGFNSLFGADRLTAQLFIAPTSTKELTFGDVNYARAWSQGLLWTEFGASASRARDSGRPAILAKVSEVERFYGRLTVPVIRARAQSLWAHLAFDARHTDEYDPLGPDADEATRVVRLSANYVNVFADTRADAALELSQGIAGLGASENGDTVFTRIDGRPQFTKLRLDASVTHRFSDRWEIAAAGAAQLADGALVAAEEFGGGGARFGRAYDYSEIIGDSGIAGSAELRWNWRNAFDRLAFLQVYAYADAVRVWNVGFDPFQFGDADLSSAGGGLRVTPVPGVLANLEVAKPLSRDVAAEGDRSARIFVSLSLGW